MRLFLEIVLFAGLIFIIYNFLKNIQFLNVLKFKNVQVINYKNYKYKERKSQLTVEGHLIKNTPVDELMKYYVVLPPNYNNNKSYPCVYFLHGLKDNALDWIEKAKLLENYEELLFRDEIQEMILILPESGADGMSWYTNWNGDMNKRYEEYFVKTLIIDVEKRYNIDKNRRGISGFSMGGYGAYKLALKNLNVYKTVGSFAGAINFSRLFLPFLKRFGIFNHLRISGKNENTAQVKRIFGNKLKYTDKENVFRLLHSRINDSYEVLKSKYFYLSVGEFDNKSYTMFQQWKDIVRFLDKHKLTYEANLIKGEEHRWEYVEKELPNILRFHSKFL